MSNYCYIFLVLFTLDERLLHQLFSLKLQARQTILEIMISLFSVLIDSGRVTMSSEIFPVIYLRGDDSNAQNEYFWDGDCGLPFSLSGSLFSLFITRLMLFIFEDVNYVLVKRFVLFGCTWITLSICISFILLFCFANFVNWPSLLDWMRFEAVDIQVPRNSFFLEVLLSFRL